MARCRVCRRDAWVKIPWANAWFCKEHFIEYFDRKVWRTFRKYVPKNHKRILFTVSGGKDSLSLLHSLAPKLLNEGYSVSALFIDLGIKGYSEYARKAVVESIEKLDIELITYDLGREEGFTIDDIARAVNERFFRKPVCSLCGIVKRYIYNRIALEHGFDLVLTGHNLNDLYGFIMSDLANGDIDDLVKLKPYIPGSEGFIAKAKPLYFNYEYENTLYTIALGVKPVYQPCPHAETQRDPLVMSFKKQLLELEKKHPGIGMMFLKNIVENLIPSLEKQFIEEKREIIRCSLCGMPSSTNPCSFCRLKTRTIKYLSKHHT